MIHSPHCGHVCHRSHGSASGKNEPILVAVRGRVGWRSIVHHPDVTVPGEMQGGSYADKAGPLEMYGDGREIVTGWVLLCSSHGGELQCRSMMCVCVCVCVRACVRACAWKSEVDEVCLLLDAYLLGLLCFAINLFGNPHIWYGVPFVWNVLAWHLVCYIWQYSSFECTSC